MEKMLFEEWAEEWLMYKKNYVKESTYANYLITMVNHLIPTFKGKRIEEMTTSTVQDAVLYWSEHGKCNGKGGLSTKTLKDMVVILKMCIRDYEIQYDREVRIRTIEYPVPKKINNQLALTQNQHEYLLYIISKNLEYESLGYAISLYTGIRIGELCALKWSDVDMNNRIIKITKTLQRIYLKSSSNKGKTKIIITPPKSVKAIREIPISDALFELLNKMQCEDKKAYLLTGTRKFIEPRLYGKHYKKFLQTYNLESIRFHGLRHTFATRCIEAGADYKIVSELLGHSSVNLTLNLYVHPHMEDKRRCVELI